MQVIVTLLALSLWDSVLARPAIENWAHLPLYACPETLLFLDDGTAAVGIWTTAQGDRLKHLHPTGNGQIHTFDADGNPLNVVDFPGIGFNIHHMAIHPVTKKHLAIDPDNERIVTVNLEDGTFEVWADELGPFPDDYDFDVHGNMYLTEVLSGLIWRITPDGTKERWLEGGILKPPTILPFASNGIVFNKKQDYLFVSHSGDNHIFRIPVSENYEAGKPEIWSLGHDVPNGITIDDRDNIWVAEFMGNEVVVLNPDGVVISRIGDFKGIDSDGTAIGLLTPTELKFHDGYLYVTNVAIDIGGASHLPMLTDYWVQNIKRHTINRIKLSDIDIWQQPQTRGRSHSEL